MQIKHRNTSLMVSLRCSFCPDDGLLAPFAAGGPGPNRFAIKLFEKAARPATTTNKFLDYLPKLYLILDLAADKGIPSNVMR